MIKSIVKDVDFLKKKSQKCTQKDMELAKDLIDTLMAHHTECVGMAANMIGVNKRAIIVDMGMMPVVMFNPVIKMKENPYFTEEGCLSLTGKRKTVRFEKIEVEYMDASWHKKTMKCEGWTAEIIQHECDHLEGIII